jgi:hypothetical protein
VSVSTETTTGQEVTLALALAEARQQQQAAQRDAAVAQALRIFLAMRVSTIVREWVDGGVGNRIFTLLSIAQRIAAGDSEDYMRTVLNVMGLDLGDIPEIDYDIFAGIASDNRDLDSLLAGAVIRVRQQKRAGKSDADAMLSGAKYLEMVVKTQISDASRGADAVVLTVADDVRAIENRQPISTVDQGRTGFGRPATRRTLPDPEPPVFTPPTQRPGFGRPATRRPTPQPDPDLERRIRDLDPVRPPGVRERPLRPIIRPPGTPAVIGQPVTLGWIRVLDPPSCGRCAVLAGRFYKWSEGFLRHPNCDCKHMPVTIAASKGIVVDADEYFASLSPDDQDRLFGKGQAEAIRNGADISQVVNATARRSGMYTADGGRRYTREGTTKRGFYGRNAAKVRRPTPWQIMKDSRGDREVAKQMLRRYGYIVSDR